jgi:hypothetical protein
VVAEDASPEVPSTECDYSPEVSARDGSHKPAKAMVSGVTKVATARAMPLDLANSSASLGVIPRPTTLMVSGSIASHKPAYLSVTVVFARFIAGLIFRVF